MNTQRLLSIHLDLPKWIEPLWQESATVYPTEEDRMRFAIRLAELNVEQKTGGPFGAAIFDRQTGRLISIGVNLVVEERCSVAHAEMVAIMLAQKRLSTYDLAAQGQPSCELVTSTEPCAMCLGAIPWSGLRRLVCGARREDAMAIGFDEGYRAPDWVAELEKRGIAVSLDVCRQDAATVLRRYKETGAALYNSERVTVP